MRHRADPDERQWYESRIGGGSRCLPPWRRLVREYSLPLRKSVLSIHAAIDRQNDTDKAVLLPLDRSAINSLEDTERRIQLVKQHLLKILAGECAEWRLGDIQRL